MERVGADPAVRGDVLVLLADRLLEDVDLDLARRLGQLARRQRRAAGERQRLQQADGEGAGGAHPGPGGDVGHRGDLQRLAVPVADQRLAQDRVADLARVVDLLELRVLEPVAALEDRVREHVDVLVDRPADQEAAVLAVVGGQVGPAAAERDAQRRAAEDHAHRASSTIRGCASSHSSVLHDGVADVHGRRPAERADLRGVELDQRAVAGPAARAAGVLEHRVDAEVAADHADRLVDDDRLVGAEVVDRHARARPRARPARSGSRARSPARTGSSCAGGRRRARAAASGRRAARGRSRSRGRACSARRGSRRSGRRRR